MSIPDVFSLEDPSERLDSVVEAFHQVHPGLEFALHDELSKLGHHHGVILRVARANKALRTRVEQKHRWSSKKKA